MVILGQVKKGSYCSDDLKASLQSIEFFRNAQE